MSDSPGNTGRDGGTSDDRGARRPHSDRPASSRSGERPTGGRPGAGRSGEGRPAYGKSGDGAAGSGRPARGGSSEGAPARGRPASAGSSDGKPPWKKNSEASSKPAWKRDGAPDEKRLWTKGGAPARGDRAASERELPEDRDPFGTRSVRSHHEAPEIPDDVTPKELDRVALNELKTLSKENAEGVAKHLVMTARLIESDPALAHQHAISAARRAGRIGVVRETLAITAYATEDYALALRELRTYRRITGRDDQLPMMVDSERGLGRPERALELGRSVPRASLPVPVQVELAIAMSGARLDLGNAESALLELQIPQLDATTAFSYSPGLFDAYATVLEELGRNEEAEQWYSRAELAAEALDGDDDDETIEVIEEEFELDEADDADVAGSVEGTESAGQGAESPRNDD